ncbi:MAG: HEAT repeat domain-containing protein [Planctomycetes bacterium]|nr:HEAT repeat domain-containing protein [Planctomycetota bacterium]
MTCTALASLCCLLALPAPGQEDATLRELIRKLDDADFQTREDAFHELVRLGAKALPLLKEAADTSDSTEVKLRAADAIRAIDLAVKVAGVYREPHRITADFVETPLAQALEEIARQAGVRVEGAANVPDQTLTLKLEKATLFEALDRICATQTQLTWDHRCEGMVTFLKEKHALGPAVYGGPFRVRVAELTVTRKTDFSDTSMTAVVQLAADYERHLKPLARVEYQISKAIDDTGAELHVSKLSAVEPPALGGGAAVVIMGLGGAAAEREGGFTIKGFRPAAARLALLTGCATFSFPLEYSDVTFTAPATGDRQEAGEFLFKITVQSGRYVELEIARSKAAEPVCQEEIDRRLDTESFVAVDTNGKEHRPESVLPSGTDAIVIGPGGVEHKLRYRVTFGSLRLRDAKQLRFRFIDRTIEKAVPFEFRDVEWP